MLQMLEDEYFVGDSVSLTLISVADSCSGEESTPLDPNLTITAIIKQEDGTSIPVSITTDSVNGVVEVLSQPLTLKGLSKLQFKYNFPTFQKTEEIIGFYVGTPL